MSSRSLTSSSGTGKTNGKDYGAQIGIGIGVVVILFLIAISVWGTCTDHGVQFFSNIKSKFPSLPGSGSGDLRSLDIVMFMDPTCPWCKKMLDVISSAGQLKNITVVDKSKPEGAAMAQQFGADKQPVPSFISRTNKTGTVGYRDSVAKLVDALKPQAVPPQAPGSSEEPGMPPGQPGMPPGQPGMPPGQIDIKALQIILFSRDGCPWCDKAKENIVNAGVADVIQVVDIMTPEGQSLAGQVLPPGTSGVPAWTSMLTKKHVIGYKPLDRIVQELYNGNIPNVMS